MIHRYHKDLVHRYHNREDPVDARRDLVDQTAALAALLERADPALPVPTCPLWTPV